jgi:hypothetical protein
MAGCSACRFPILIAPCALTWAAACANGTIALAPATRLTTPAE